MSMSYKNKIKLIDGDYYNHGLKDDSFIKSLFKLGLLLTVAVFGFLYLFKNTNLI